MRRIISLVLVAVIAMSFVGCASKSDNKEVNIEEIHKAVKEVYGETYVPNMLFDETTFSDIFGVSSDLYDSYIAEGPAISVQVDTFVAVDAKEGKGEAVEKALKDYSDKLINDSFQYPMNMPRVQAGTVVRHGDYVFYLLLGTLDIDPKIEEQGNEEAITKAVKEKNQIGIDKVDSFFK